MPAKIHEYSPTIKWTGNTGTGTSGYKDYQRNWELCSGGKSIVQCSNDPILGGDPEKYNPEDMLIAALSSCHMLWYLHLCSTKNIAVTQYSDTPRGLGELEKTGAGRFTKVILRPHITITSTSDMKKAVAIHDEIHQYCFIARSVNFPIVIEPIIQFHQSGATQ